MDWFSAHKELFTALLLLVVTGVGTVIWYFIRRWVEKPSAFAGLRPYQTVQSVAVGGSVVNTQTTSGGVQQTIEVGVTPPPVVSEPIPVRYLEHPTPVEIFRTIHDTPPFHEHIVRESFVGQYVCWDLCLGSMKTSTRDARKTALLLFQPDEDRNAIVECETDLTLRPELKLAARGRLISVRGRIEQVDPIIIHLVDARVDLP